MGVEVAGYPAVAVNDGELGDVREIIPSVGRATASLYLEDCEVNRKTV
jgi:hypothetical protein